MRFHWFFAGWMAAVIFSLFMRGPDAVAAMPANIASWLSLDGLRVAAIVAVIVVAIGGGVAWLAKKFEPKGPPEAAGED